MRRVHVLPRALVPALLAVAAGIATAGPAAADSPTPDTPTAAITSSVAPPGKADVKSTVTTASEQQQIEGYWTTERMRNAKPADSLVSESQKAPTSGPVAVGVPTVYGGSPSQQATTSTLDSTGGYYYGGGYAQLTTGKLFFTRGGVDYTCSGSSIVSTNHDVISTAGHCLYASGVWSSNVEFVPGYNNGAQPYGNFTARTLVVPAEWTGSLGEDYDVGFAAMYTQNGVHINDKVGGQGIGFNQPRGAYVYDFAYPDYSPYNGEHIAWCSGTEISNPYGHSSQGLDCNFNGGSSGGPWLANYSTSTGLGIETSVNTFRYSSGPYTAYMWGPYFGSAAQGAYNSAASA